MPKMKTNRAAAKRFRLTGSGKLRRRKMGKGHHLTIKAQKRKRSLRKPTLVSAVDSRRMKRLLGM